MDYTTSPQYAVHPGTGNRMHDDAATLPTVLTDGDINQMTWSMMEVVKAAGLAPSVFNADIPATYTQFLQALQVITAGLIPAPVAPVAAIAPGMVAYFPYTGAPSGWIKANGAVVSRGLYAGLFAALGTYYGAGDGVSTFGIPDLRGVFLRGLDEGRGIDSGRTLGALQADSFKSHTHDYVGTGNGTPGGAEGGGRDAAGTGPIYTSEATGSAETRPINLALVAYIRY
jgi:phage-related tail fiber protein